MATFTIKARDYGDITFFMPEDGGYIHLELPEKPGTLGPQICAKGELLGETLKATPETFEKVCRSWHRMQIESIKDTTCAYAGYFESKKKGRPVVMPTGENIISEVRRRRGWNQKILAARLGISQDMVSRYEREERLIPGPVKILCEQLLQEKAY